MSVPYSDAILALAVRHVAEGEIRIHRQRQTIVDLTAIGADTLQAEAVLDAMLTTLALMVDHRDRILAQRRRRGIDKVAG